MALPRVERGLHPNVFEVGVPGPVRYFVESSKAPREERKASTTSRGPITLCSMTGPLQVVGFLFEVDLVDWMGGSQLNRRWSAYDRTLYFRVESSVIMGIAAVCVSVFWNGWVCSRETRHLYLSCLLTSKPGRISAPRGSTCEAQNS